MNRNIILVVGLVGDGKIYKDESVVIGTLSPQYYLSRHAGLLFFYEEFVGGLVW